MIVISKPDKGSGVVVMDRANYVDKMMKILDDVTKFRVIDADKPTRGRKPLVSHPLLQKEADLDRVLTSMKEKLPNDVRNEIRPHGSRLAHMYGLPKLHKQGVPLRPVLSATGTYNFKLAKWLNSILQPLIPAKHTVDSAFDFVDMLDDVPSAETMVSFDVVSLFTNVPVGETIQVILDAVFDTSGESSFLEDQGIRLQRRDLQLLLEKATVNMLFTFDGVLYEQIDGVSMGSPLGPLFANFYLGFLEISVFAENHNFFPVFYVRYVDDTFLLFSDPTHVQLFLERLNRFHPAIQFTCEFSVDSSIPFIGVTVVMSKTGFSTSVYHKSCDKGVFLHSQSFCDEKYKRNLMPMLCHRAFALSSSWTGFHEEIERSVKCLTQLGYDECVLGSQVRHFLTRRLGPESSTQKEKSKLVPLVLPYKGESAKKRLISSFSALCRRVNTECPGLVFTSTSVGSLVRLPEAKPKVVNSGGVTYMFKCPQTGCESRYVGVTRRHLFQRVREHLAERKDGSSSVIFDHLMFHDVRPTFETHLECFSILKKSSKWRSLLFTEAYHIKHQKCDLNTQTDSIPLRVF